MLNVLCFTAPVNSCGYVSEAGYLLSPAIKWNGQLHILGAGLNFMKFSCFKWIMSSNRHLQCETIFFLSHMFQIGSFCKRTLSPLLLYLFLMIGTLSPVLNFNTIYACVLYRFSVVYLSLPYLPQSQRESEKFLNEDFFCKTVSCILPQINLQAFS